MTNRKKCAVFLSYSSVDKTWVSRLKNALQARGLKVWLDRDEIRPGDLFVGALETGLEESKAVALIVSPESIASGWVREEYSRALSLSQEKNQPLQLIPVILREAELPGFLANRNWVDFRDELAFDENLEQLIWGITGKKPSDSSPRPFDKQATKQHPGNAVLIQVEENSADFVLFRANNGQLYFIPLQDASWASTEISLQLIPETTDESAFLRSLRTNRHTTFAFALWGDAAWVNPREVTQTMSGAQTVWTVVLQKDNRRQDFGLFNEVTFDNISADKIAEMRAKRILLNEELEFYKDSQNLVNRLNKATLEVYVRGLGSPLQPLASPIP